MREYTHVSGYFTEPRPYRSWWSRVLAIPGYAAGWIGDHFINVLVLLFVILLMANLTQPL